MHEHNNPRRLYANCVKLSESSSRDADINIIVEAAYDHWTLSMQRFPARSNGKQGRKKKVEGIALADLFEREAKEARKAHGSNNILDDSDDDSSDDDEHYEGDYNEQETRADGGAGVEASDNGDETDKNQFLSIGDFDVPIGWVALEQPADTDLQWKSMQKNYKWQNKKLAHIWDAPLGWQMASFSHWEQKKGMSCFYYPTDRQKVARHMNLGDYGIDGLWVLLQKASVESARTN